jgi:hypothetical protein
MDQREMFMKKKKCTYRLLFLLVTILPVYFILKSCGGCFPDVKVNPTSNSGSATIEIRDIPKPRSGTNYVSISIGGNLQSGSGGSGRSSFSDTRTFEVTPDAINPAPLVTKTALKPGNWKVSVSSAGWSASGTGTVPSGGSRTFIFTYNSTNVSIQ